MKFASEHRFPRKRQKKRLSQFRRERFGDPIKRLDALPISLHSDFRRQFHKRAREVIRVQGPPKADVILTGQLHELPRISQFRGKLRLSPQRSLLEQAAGGEKTRKIKQPARAGFILLRSQHRLNVSDLSAKQLVHVARIKRQQQLSRLVDRA